jgi:hypothetical protein
MNTLNRTGQTGARARFIVIASTLIALALLATGCSSNAIFATIESEAELADPTVLGTVYSLLACDENGDGVKDLYCTNGYIYKKTKGTGGWSQISGPSSSVRCFALATDELDGTGSLYGLFVATDDWSVFDSVQEYDGTTWTKVTGLSDVDKIGSGDGVVYAFVNAGSNDSPSYTAYVTTGAGATTFSTTALASAMPLPVGTAGDFVATTTPVYYYDGASLSALSLTNLPTAGINAITTDPSGTYAYIATAGNVYKFTSTAVTAITGHSTSTPVSDIAYLDTGSDTDFILVAGAEGYGEIPVYADGSWGSYQTPGSTTPSSISTGAKDQYESSLENYVIQKIYPVSDPVPSGNSYMLYASITYTSYDGLWAYYPGTRTEWNREQ